MRNFNEEIQCYLNNEISKSPSNWAYASGANFGIPLQKLIGKYYKDNSEKLNITKVVINTNPNCLDPDVVLTFNDCKIRGIEVKSCKDGSLTGVTICNSPQLINDKEAILINYTFVNNTLNVIAVIFTQIFRLITINKTGKYAGCLSSTRDTGKKIKGRNYNEFISSSNKDDYTLEQLTNPSLIRKTVLYYSASKLVDKNYNFTDEEILKAIRHLRKI